MSTMTHPGQPDSRLLAWCIGGSMLLHALIMWQGHGVRSDAVPTTEIRVNIRAAAPPAPPTAPVVQPQPEPPKPEPPKPEPAKAQPKPEPPPRAPDRLARPELRGPAPEPKAAPQVAPPSAPSAPPAENKSEAKSEGAKAAPVPAPAAPSAPSAPSVADADDAALVRSYQLQLAQVTNKTKVYPNVALTQEWQGETLVRLRIGADGNMKAVEIGSGSGHELLDEKAREAVTKAKTRVLVPDGLKGKEFIAEVRVIFKIEK